MRLHGTSGVNHAWNARRYASPRSFVNEIPKDLGTTYLKHPSTIMNPLSNVAVSQKGRGRMKRACGGLVRTVALLATLVILATQPVAADDASDLKALQQRQQELEAAKAGAENAMDRLYYQQKETEVTIALTEQELALAQAKVAVTTTQLDTTRQELAELQVSLAQAEADYAAQKLRFNRRLRAIQEESPISYLGLLLESNDVSDFLSRWDRVKAVVQNDNAIIRSMRTIKLELDKQRAAVAQREATLSGLLAAQQEASHTVELKLADLSQLQADLAAQQADLQAAVEEYEKERELVEQEIYAVQERMRRAAGRFAPIFPLKGRPVITDDFGFGPDPVVGGNRNHGGTDFAGKTGDPIMAIEGGEVIYTGYDRTYGNRVVIDHGGGIASWYAHASAILVSVGQEVQQGEVIARVGSTGYSTGPHLHLEVRINNEKKDPMEYIR
jgi:murein DD-endopeptidase MepM/ murein hydrolase activator NlpD